jgi:hypothetical protein
MVEHTEPEQLCHLRGYILSINTRSLDEVHGWIERMRSYWEERLDAMERLLHELKKDHKLGPKDRKRTF